MTGWLHVPTLRHVQTWMVWLVFVTLIMEHQDFVKHAQLLNLENVRTVKVVVSKTGKDKSNAHVFVVKVRKFCRNHINKVFEIMIYFHKNSNLRCNYKLFQSLAQIRLSVKAKPAWLMIKDIVVLVKVILGFVSIAVK